MALSNKQSKERVYELRMLEKKYQQRFTLTRVAKEAQAKGDIKTMVMKYTEYLKLMGDIHECGIYDLKPAKFDQKKQVSEMLLISQIYYELAKVYDAAPDLKAKTDACLKQFVKFSINQPYQVLNSEILRKHLKRSKFKNNEMFQSALKSIFSGSSKCYIATYCFGDEHYITNNFRNFKYYICKFNLGVYFTAWYYKNSPKFITYMQQKPVFGFLLKNLLIKPILFIDGNLLGVLSLINGPIRKIYRKILD